MDGLVPLSHIRQKVQVMYRDYLEDSEAFKRQPDSFVFHQVGSSSDMLVLLLAVLRNSKMANHNTYYTTTYFRTGGPFLNTTGIDIRPLYAQTIRSCTYKPGDECSRCVYGLPAMVLVPS